MYRCLQRTHSSKALKRLPLAGQGVARAVTPAVGFCGRAEEDHKAQAPPGFSPEAEDCGYAQLCSLELKKAWAGRQA